MEKYVPNSRAVYPIVLTVVMALLLWLPAQSSAAGCTITWVGDVDGNWFGGTSGSNTNWCGDMFPGASDHACLGDAAAPYTVQLNGSARQSVITRSMPMPPSGW